MLTPHDASDFAIGIAFDDADSMAMCGDNDEKS